MSNKTLVQITVEAFEYDALNELFGERMTVVPEQTEEESALEETPLPSEPSPEPEAASVEEDDNPVERRDGESALAWLMRRARVAVNWKQKPIDTSDPDYVPPVVNEPANDNPDSIITKFRRAAIRSTNEPVPNDKRNRHTKTTFVALAGREWGNTPSYGRLDVPGLISRGHWTFELFRNDIRIQGPHRTRDPITFFANDKDVRDTRIRYVLRITDDYGNTTDVEFFPENPGRYTYIQVSAGATIMLRSASSEFPEVGDGDRSNNNTVFFKEQAGQEWGTSRQYPAFEVPGLLPNSEWRSRVKIEGKEVLDFRGYGPKTFTVTQQDVNRSATAVVKIEDDFFNDTFVIFGPKAPGTYTVKYVFEDGKLKFKASYQP